MPKSMSPFLAHVVGPPEFGRYVIRRNFIEPPDFYTGSDAEPWTEDLRKARLFASLGDLRHDIHELARSELAHLPQVRYRLEVEVLAIGDVTQEQVRDYLSAALTIGLDEEAHGPGPGFGVVLARADLRSLRPEDEVQ